MKLPFAFLYTHRLTNILDFPSLLMVLKRLTDLPNSTVVDSLFVELIEL